MIMTTNNAKLMTTTTIITTIAIIILFLMMMMMTMTTTTMMITITITATPITMALTIMITTLTGAQAFTTESRSYMHSDSREREMSRFGEGTPISRMMSGGFLHVMSPAIGCNRRQMDSSRMKEKKIIGDNKPRREKKRIWQENAAR